MGGNRGFMDVWYAAVVEFAEIPSRYGWNIFNYNFDGCGMA